MNFKALIAMSALSLIISSSWVHAQEKSLPEKPNIVLILTDDVRYSAYSCTGNTLFKTPHVDQLRQEGTFCTEAYATHMVCAPSRAGLITGRYQARCHYETWTGDTESARSKDLGVDTREIFMSEVLRDAGYKTAAIGKWHLGVKDYYQPPARGFDYSFNFLGRCDYFDWTDLVENGVQAEGEGYVPDAQTDRALAFIEENKDRPFFLYYATALTHSPNDVADKYKPQERVAKGQGMVNALDAQVGRINARLKELGLEKNTLLVFTNDNGAPGADTNSNGPFRGGKKEFWEGGLRVPFIVKWPGVIPAGVTYKKGIISNLDLFTTFVHVAGAKLPEDRAYDGINFLPYLTGESTAVPDRIHCWRGIQGYFIRKGNYKMHLLVDPEEYNRKYQEVHGHKQGRTTLPLFDLSLTREILLYDLSNDIAEQHNIADQHPEVVAQLRKEVARYSKLRENDPVYAEEASKK